VPIGQQVIEIYNDNSQSLVSLVECSGSIVAGRARCAGETLFGVSTDTRRSARPPVLK
jgi:hypothetical protein